MMNNLPQGWEILPFFKCVKKISIKYKLKTKDYLVYGKYPIIDQAKDFISGYCNSANLLINIEKPVIVFGDHTRCFKFVDFDFIAGADGIKILQPINKFDEKLFYYFCLALQFENKGYSRHYQFLEKVNMRIPPLETQQKIVAKLESEFAKIEAAKSHLEKVKETIPRLKNSLLKSAFSGKLTQPCKDERGAPHCHCEDSSESKAHNPQGFCPHSQTYNAEVPQDSIAESKACKIVDCHELHCNSRNDESIAQAPNFTRAPNLGGATSVAQNLQSDTNPPNYHLECNEREESRIVDSHRDISHFSNTQYDKKDNLPQGWEIKTLGEVFEVIGGGTPSTEKSEFWSGDIAWITSANIASENFTITPQKFINQEAIKSSATKLVPKNTIIVVTRVGLGKVGITNVETCFSQDSQALLPMQIVDTKFMAFQIKKEASQFIINSRGTTISGITKDTLKKLKLKIPPLQIQKQIVEILDSKFAALENLKKETNASLEKLQKLKSSLLNLAFKGELI